MNGLAFLLRTLFKWKKCIELRLHRNKPATKIDMEALQKHVDDCPDSYQHERAAHFGVSSSCILYALRRLGIRNKKTLFHHQSKCGKRAEFAAEQYQYEQVAVRLFIWMRAGFALMPQEIADTVSEGRDAVAAEAGSINEG